MPLEKPLEFITEADLQELISAAVPEQSVVEYKSQLPTNSDNDKKEFLADVSSFANALGGHIIFGMEEVAGLPTGLAGVQVIDLNSEKLRLENIIRTGIAPRIPNVQIGEPLRLTSGRIVFIIRIPKSWISPHMVTYQGTSRFYSRNSAGKHQLDIQQLRSAFLSSAATAERLRDFRAERLSRIGSENMPVRLHPGLRVVAHVIPLNALDTRESFDCVALRSIHTAGDIQPLLSNHVYNARYNFDGYLIAEQFESTRNVVSSYLQLFRSGIFESVNAVPSATKSIPSFDLEGRIIKQLPRYFKAMQRLGIRPPIFVALSLINVVGHVLDLPKEASWSYFNYPAGTIEEQNLIMSEVMFETFENDPGEILKPVFDTVWNAAGWEQSIYYEGSEWTGLNRFFSR